MTQYGAMVLVDGVSLVCSCPYHGAQPGAEYTEQRAPCGCSWVLDSHGVLRSLPGEVADVQQELSQVADTGHKGQTT